MTRKDYVLLTLALQQAITEERTRRDTTDRSASINAARRVVSAISNAMKLDNPHFDEERFADNVLGPFHRDVL